MNTFFRAISIHLAVAMLLLSPTIVLAQTFTYFSTGLAQLDAVIMTAVPVLVGIALLLFIWGLVTFIQNSGNEKELEVGKQRMVWGILALFVIVSVWGLVTLMQELSGVGSAAPPAPPAII